MNTDKGKQTIIDLFDLEGMAPEKVAEMVERLGRLILQATLVRVLPLLSDSEGEEYDKILEEKEGIEKIFGFLEAKVPNFNEIVAEEAELLRAELAGEFEKIKV